ncbi:MAG: type II toxin-antitoxin system RelE/ParE family toxin [Omnitrophica bacterium]|nr:type II toxin-antitoxin system RelE/ParE family toxin [Candidatus Omnitrophota bacterium]
MHRILYTKEAKTAIDKLPLKKQRQIKEAVERIASNPEIGKHLIQELKGLSSYRSGDCRIIYKADHKEILVLILTVGHRKDIYKQISRKLH